MKGIKSILVLIVLLGFNTICSQDSIPVLNFKDSVLTSYWIVGAGFNIVDDSEEGFSTLSTISGQWNMLPYPSRFSFGRRFKGGLGLELIGTFNRYKAGNTINSVVISENIPYRALDMRLTYDLSSILGNSRFLNPYIGAGFGTSNSSNTTYPTYNAIVGLRMWFSENWGIDLNSSGKWEGLNKVNNHVQHAAAVIYRFGIQQELNESGRQKLAEIDSIAKTAKARQDSIRLADQATRLSELKMKEEEAAELAKTRELEAREAMSQRRNALKKELESKGNILFGFDSYALKASQKSILDTLIAFIIDYPDLNFEIQAHTDSRGASEYNYRLSERRAQTVFDYLVQKGINPTRLKTRGFGETRPENGCGDGVWCSGQAHALNRRCTIFITD